MTVDGCNAVEKRAVRYHSSLPSPKPHPSGTATQPQPDGEHLIKMEYRNVYSDWTPSAGKGVQV